MNTQQLKRIFSANADFVGVFPSDQIPLIQPSFIVKCLIINLDPSNKPGSHWVALSYHRNKLGRNEMEYFDSYGFPPYLTIPIRGKNWHLSYNRTRFQKEKSVVCGQHCVHFVDKRLAGVDFKTFLVQLGKVRDPDKYVRIYVKKKFGKICSLPLLCTGEVNQCCVSEFHKCSPCLKKTHHVFNQHNFRKKTNTKR